MARLIVFSFENMIYRTVLLFFVVYSGVSSFSPFFGGHHAHHHGFMHHRGPHFHRPNPEIDSNEDTLQLVHVLFRHGHRNPDAVSLYPKGPYYNESFYPEGYGQLTNEGKMTEYTLGTELRKRYDKFLGDTWNINYLEARSSDYNRTKMSLQLMLAALYPPKGSQIWSQLPWQPIPFNYVPTSQDKELFPFDACINKYEALMKEITQRPDISKYFNNRYGETFDILTERAERKMDIVQAFFLYVGFYIQEELGYSLEDWTKSVYPEPLHSAAVDMYYIMTNNTEIKSIISGYLLKKILSDTKAKIDNQIQPSQRKMFIYSGHELNVATMLLSLNAYKLSDVPPYGSYILFELHLINGVHGIKLFYQNYKNEEPIQLKLPGCDSFCPFQEFYKLVDEILPKSDEDCYENIA
ncbi:venom acid phosphatase Acph-1-like [Sitophilus oryzae]|uniref:acid phosphatase n=1 Tax=Sitophilus oryzae TaxID=7048 RepID=A0A6J2Y1Y2_SITOR|nr:venom acid phosphatase Acph-1-like [Sitophilus oryzae]